MRIERESREDRQKRLYMQLQAAGRNLTREQYRTCKGWIGAGQLDTVERFLRKRDLSRRMGTREEDMA